MFNFKIRSKLFLSFAVVIVVLAAIILLSDSNFNKAVQANGWNIHTYQVMSESDAMLASLINIETGQRGFLLAKEESFLDPLNQGMKDFNSHFQSIKQLTSDNAAQQTRLVNLQQAEDKWMNEFINPLITQTKNTATSVDGIELTKGKSYMDNLRSMISEIKSNEESLLENVPKT